MVHGILLNETNDDNSHHYNSITLIFQVLLKLMLGKILCTSCQHIIILLSTVLSLLIL